MQDKKNNELYKYFYSDDINAITIELFYFFEKEVNLFLNKNSYFYNKIANLDKKFNCIEKIIKIVFLFSRKPLITYREICVILKINKNDLIILNNIIKNIDLFQKIIIKKGIGTKYWTNTIIPLYNSKSVQKFLNKKYSFPYRVGLFPGLSCMFKCSFCGRNYDAAYKKDSLSLGMEIFFKLIEESPTNDPSRFFISGGLEPLTNPDLSKLIIKLKEKKFNASMYTNGYMLTKKYLEKNDFIFNLDSLRISYYGINPENTFKVTKKKQAFEIVNENIINYLIQKEIRNSKTSFGINYVILKNQNSDVIDLLNIFSDINKKINNNKNNFNFLTLREDFRILGERMTLNERDSLHITFKKINEYIKQDKILSNLFIDYGFALEPIRNGYIGNKLEDNFASKEDLGILGVPQARVVVDLLGDVYLFGEAGFLERPGAKKYIIGNLIKQGSMKDVITNFINLRNNNIEILESDRDFLDAWDHITIKFANQQKDNLEFGIFDKDSAINIDSINSLIKSNYQVHYSV
jgi:dTDP-4-amino-4,6-dideoxy-D-glucose ammonia-lyase